MDCLTIAYRLHGGEMSVLLGFGASFYGDDGD